MKAFDPFTATLDEALEQPDAHAQNGSVLRWGSAQQITAKKDYYTRRPIDGVAACVRYGLITPDWLATAFLRQYDKVLTCKTATWGEAFEPAHPDGQHLSTSKLNRNFGWQIERLFADDDFHGRKSLPRTLDGRKAAARILGITEKQVRVLLPKTRTNIKGHKSYKAAISAGARANDPFSLTIQKVPEK